MDTYIRELIDEMKRVHHLHMKVGAQYMSTSAISKDQAILLYFIKKGKMSQKEIAKELHIRESTLSVIKCITSAPQNVLAYLLGYFFGTYLGCYIEEKLALGTNMITCITTNNSLPTMLRKNGYLVTTIDGYGLEKQNVLLIIISRKKVYKLTKLIKSVDKKSVITLNNINYFNK